MPQFRLILTPRASTDMEAIHDYLADRSPQAAENIITHILDSLESLRQFPNRAPIEHHSRDLHHPVRFLVIVPYIVYFRVIASDEVIRVLHVRHGARRLPERFDK